MQTIFNASHRDVELPFIKGDCSLSHFHEINDSFYDIIEPIDVPKVFIYDIIEKQLKVMSWQAIFSMKPLSCTHDITHVIKGVFCVIKDIIYDINALSHDINDNIYEVKVNTMKSWKEGTHVILNLKPNYAITTKVKYEV